MTAKLAATGFLMMAATLAGSAPPGRATIAGVIVSADSAPQPIADAVVSVSGGDIRDNLSVLTDEAGRFAFPNLVPARYMVSVWKPAYLLTRYGASRPGRPGASVAAEDGKTVDLRLTMARGAVIGGIVRGQFGEALPGVDVLLVRFNASDPGAQYIEDILTTDDRGMYRAYGLLPDEYIVAAMPLRLAQNVDTYAPSREEVDAKIRRLEQRFAQIQAPAAPAGPVGGRREDAAAAETPFVIGPTYYPGTASVADAAHVRVAAGEERLGVDIRLAPVRTVKVSGIIQAGGLPPQRFRPQLISIGSPSILGSPSLAGQTVDGAFTFVNVTPGRYAVVARTGPGIVGMPLTAPNDGPAPPVYGVAEITVADTDVTGVVVSLRPAPVVTGRVVFDGATTPPPVNLEIVRLVVSAVRVGASPLELAMGGSGTTNVRGDGTFTFNNLLPGSYRISSPMAGWWMRSAIANGRDIIDQPLQIDATTTDLPPIAVTFTDRRTELHGILMTATDQPASEFVVVVFPVTRDFWRPGARRIRSVRPASDGAFSLMDLPAGEYFVAAVTDADPDEWQQPSFLEQLLPASIKISIVEGQRTRQDLRIVR